MPMRIVRKLVPPNPNKNSASKGAILSIDKEIVLQSHFGTSPFSYWITVYLDIIAMGKYSELLPSSK